LLVAKQASNAVSRFKTFNCFCVILFLRPFLWLTPTLWTPGIFKYMLYFLASASDTPNFALLYDDTTLEWVWGGEPPVRCMSWEEKRNATLAGAASVEQVSGLYGPGTYMAWLVVAYSSALSSIWHSGGSKHGADTSTRDLDSFAALLYPIVTLADILSRLVRCKIDPQIDAAMFVVLSSMMILRPAARLSWQHEKAEPTDQLIPQTHGQWVGEVVHFLSHLILWTVTGEPYAYTGLGWAVYGLLLVVMLYSLVCSEFLTDTYPYRQWAYRPRLERAGVFCALQLVFGIILLTTGHYSILPATGASLLDLDQAAALLAAVLVLLYSKWGVFETLVSKYRHQQAGFLPVHEFREQASQPEPMRNESNLREGTRTPEAAAAPQYTSLESA
jgi:hypothetical protein